ncbi:MAG: hypothetical protein H6506_04115 [Calditrichaeota bacterium]|nr:hypothetical protein [Calditrichota bacterium]MCB9366055.1 hypothetical protein [Calditrichota bacterium]MCB9391819.1 hypothetical protein [Calditrichota bacterium]
MLRSLILLTSLLAGFSLSLASDYVHHSLLRVYGKSPAHEKQLLRDDNLDVLPVDDKPGVLIAALPDDMPYLTSQGYRWDVIEMDLESFYARRAREENPLDDMGGYKTHSEILAEMDAIHAAYPNITTARFSVGRTIEGRDIHCMKISDNPDVDEDEIELLYNSLIHAREPAAMEVLFMFMDSLTSLYGVNPDVTDLVDNREFFFIPCINVDGYLYNEATNPGGGGMWRKNRRNNGTSFGVDLNRNWGFNWGFDNSGSSPTPSSETYRGSGPFSEPETDSLRSFIESREFVLSMNYHTYSNLILYPWGTQAYQGGFCPDNSTFALMADSMQTLIQAVNGAVYSVGPPWQLLYDVNGDCNDWCYGEQTSKGKIFGFTTEVGGASDGFWPAQSRIAPLAAENLPANFFVARYAEQLVPPDYHVTKIFQSQTDANGDNNGVVEPGEDAEMLINLRNTGALDLTAISGTLTTSTPNVTVLSGSAAWPALNTQQSAENTTPFVLSIGAGFSSPGAVACELHLTTSNGLDTTLTVNAVVGNPGFSDNMEFGSNGWTHSGSNDGWHLSTRAANSPTHSWYSGNEGTGTYPSNMNAVLTSPPLLLGNNPVLFFSHRYNLEADFDFGFVEVTDGATSVIVAGPYTGNSGGFQTVNVSLAQFGPGSTVQVKFRQTSDSFVEEEGWYVDDVSLGTAPTIDAAPGAVTLGLDPLDTATRDVVISNSGGSDLVYSVLFQNGTAATDTGGPDAFGYRWQDSDDACGPAFSWLPIASSGTQLSWLSNEGDLSRGPFTLPFDFPFYETEYSRIWINANGWISFIDSTSTAYLNTALPSSTAPAAAIFAWWDDLKPQLAGTNVRYWDNGLDSAAVHFENIRAGTAPSQGTYNFQILLTARGECRVFYADMGTIRLTSATIGIQDASKTRGLTALNNQAGIGNNEARRFALGPRWVSVLPISGVVAPNATDTLRLSFLGPELCGDPSLSGLIIRSNDPQSAEYVVPITVTGVVTPDAPTELTILPDGNDVILHWMPSAGAASYRVYFYQETGGLPTIVGETTDTTFTHTDALSTAFGIYTVVALP